MADEGYDPVARRAAFAQNFQNTTNLDQRRRYAQDIAEAKQRDDERKAQQFEQMQLQRPEVGRLILSREKEDRAAREAFQRQDLAERKFQFEQGKASRLEALNAKKLELQMQQENRLITKQERDLERQNQQETDIVNAEDTEYALRQKFGPGSKEYRDGLMESALRYKFLPADYRNTMLKAAGWEDPEVAFRTASDLAAQTPGSRVTGVPVPGGGGAKMSIAGPKQEKEVTASTGRMDSLRTKIAKEFAKPEDERDKDYLGYLQSQFEVEKNKGGQAQVATTPTPAPASGTQTPTQTATIWRMDKSGNRWEYDANTKKPTGNYVPAK